jgi:Leucine-rich repeat (LRR) protein
LDSALFEQQQLNFLQLTNSSEFCEVSDEIQKLENLQSLLVFGNRLSLLPSEYFSAVMKVSLTFFAPGSIECLTKLKILDVSNNQLTEFNFDLTKMDHLATLNLSGNQIASFNVKSASLHEQERNQGHSRRSQLAEFEALGPQWESDHRDTEEFRGVEVEK